MNKRSITAQPNCEDELNTGLLTVEEAQARIMADISPVDATETVSLRESLGIGDEQIELPDGVHDLPGLTRWLQSRDGTWDTALADSRLHEKSI